MGRGQARMGKNVKGENAPLQQNLDPDTPKTPDPEDAFYEHSDERQAEWRRRVIEVQGQRVDRRQAMKLSSGFSGSRGGMKSLYNAELALIKQSRIQFQLKMELYKDSLAMIKTQCRQNTEDNVDRIQELDDHLRQNSHELQDLEALMRRRAALHSVGTSELTSIGQAHFRMAELDHSLRFQRLCNELLSELRQSHRTFQLSKRRVAKSLQMLQISSKTEANRETTDFENLRDSIRTGSLHKLNDLSASLSSMIEGMERRFKLAHDEYLDTNQSRTADYIRLVRKDEQNANIILKNQRRAQDLRKSTAAYRKGLQQSYHEYLLHNKEMRLAIDELQIHVSERRTLLRRQQKGRHGRMTKLSKRSRDAREKLEEILKIAARVLEMAEYSRRLQNDDPAMLRMAETGHQTYKDDMLASQFRSAPKLSLSKPDQASSPQPHREGEYAADEGSGDAVPLKMPHPPTSPRDAASTLRRKSSLFSSRHHHHQRMTSVYTTTSGLQTSRPFDEEVDFAERLGEFTKRFNLSVSSLCEARMEKQNELRLNQALRRSLLMWQNNVTIAGTAVDDSNPLLAVNGRDGIRNRMLMHQTFLRKQHQLNL